MAKLKLKGGVLIIGSLYWQDSLRDQPTARKDWRRSHLDMDAGILVHAPIRYGRMSGETYTMTFAWSARPTPGQAWLVPFKQYIEDTDDLLKEATALSAAEGMHGQFIRSSNREPWAVLGILFNPDKIKKEQQDLIASWWSDQLSKEASFTNFDPDDFCLGKSEKPCILKNGSLNFPWVTVVKPKDSKQLDSFDFLIATATRPTPPKYPTLQQLAGNIENDTERQYFKNNRKSQIFTFQDEKIIRKLSRN